MKKIVILSGAGISAESGISTFRGNGGLWEQYDVMDVASAQGWKKNPALVLDFYNRRRAQLANAEPNQAHIDIAALEKDFDVVVITQNVDNLHEKAGSTKVIHLHGELTKIRPEDSYTEEDGYDESKMGPEMWMSVVFSTGRISSSSEKPSRNSRTRSEN